MYSAKDVQAMTDDEAREAVDRLACQHYGHDRWKSQFAKDTGMTRSTVQRWFVESRPPSWVVVMLGALTERDAARAELDKIKATLRAAFDPKALETD